MESELSKAIQGNDFAKASELLPDKIELVFEQPKIYEMVKALGKDSIKRMLEFELITLAALMSVGGNLNENQVLFISDQLLSLYPYETIADFKLCFKRGAMGLYGDVQRMDGITVNSWVKQYLAEKYEVLEKRLKAESEKPSTEYGPDPEYDPEKHSEWLNKLAEVCKPIQKIPGMTEEEIKRLGNPKIKFRKPTITAGYAYFHVRGVQIFAESQEHAERLCELLIKNGDLEEDI